MPEVLNNSFKIHYLSENHEIAARVLAESLSGYSGVLEEINREFASGQHVEVRITALSGGSFTVGIYLWFSTAWDQIKSLFSEENSQTAGNFVEVLTKLLELRKAFGKEKPDPIEQDESSVTLQDAAGEKIRLDGFTFNLYNSNVQINNGIDRAIMPVCTSPELQGFEILDADNNLIFEAKDKSTVAKMIEISPTSDSTESELSVKRQMRLTVGAFDFDEKNKSRFLHLGRPFWAKISDHDFWLRSYQGLESIDPGDVLEAEVVSIGSSSDGGESITYKEHDIVHVIHH